MSFGAWAGMLGAGAAGAGGGFGSALMNWGLANKSANRYKSSVRHLRRREYQDMMFSMKKAGLNPILAYGGTPGHSASQMVQAPNIDITGNATKGISTANEAAQVQGKVAKLDAEAKASAAQAQRTKGLITNDQWAVATADANIKNTNQATLTSAAQANLFRQEAIKSGASARQLEALEQNLRADLPNIQSGFGKGRERGVLNAIQNANPTGGFHTPTEAGQAAGQKAREWLGTTADEVRKWWNK